MTIAEELNVRLAELCGFRWMRWGNHPNAMLFLIPPGLCNHGSFVVSARKPGETFRKDYLPHYSTDLNAVAAVEAGLTENQQGEFINALCTICEPDRSKPGTAMFKAFFATARQHTVALIATLTP